MYKWTIPSVVKKYTFLCWIFWVFVGKNGRPQHTCSLVSETIREEVESLKLDFNKCMKDILFNSLYYAYYCGFIPCCFTQNTLYYDVWWVSQHTVVLWISMLVLYTSYYLSPYYCDVLHRAALHLGRWQKVEGRNAHVPYNVWSELQTWPQNALVKHIKGLFKAEAVCNAAEPGNSSHQRFYFLFHEPLRVVSLLLAVQLCVAVVQLGMLIRSTEWNHLVSLSLLLFCNYYTLFRLARDYLLMAKVYKAEHNLNETD